MVYCMAININDRKFQVKLLALSIKNPQFLKKYRHALKADWLETPELRMIADIIFTYFDQYNEAPDGDTLEFLVQNIVNTDKYSEEEWRKLVRMIISQGDEGLTYIFDHVAEFIEYRAMKEAILTSAQLLENGEYGKIPETIRKAQKWSQESVPSVDFFDDIYNWLLKKDIRQTIPTGITELDEILAGGTARGEVSVVLAPPSTGKTTTLINFGAAAIMSGARVYHFHAEQTTDVVRARYVTRLSGVPYKNIKDNPTAMVKRMELVKEKSGGDLLISKCAGSTISAIRSFIYKRDVPDVIIIDYADKLVPRTHFNDKRHEISSIYDEMVIMGEEFNASMLTASQTNRQAVGKQKVTIKDLAEDFQKAAIADNVFALCQTEEERAMNVIRIFMAKIRNEDDGMNEIECKMMKHMMTILSASDYTKQMTGAILQ